MSSPSPRLTLRPYQVECVDAVMHALRSDVKRPAVVLPTGAGKTVCFSEVCRQFLAWVKRRVLVLAHRTELIEQAAAKIRMMLAGTGLRVGIVKGQRNEIYADVIVASVQSLATERRRNMLTGVGLIIVDECHHAAAPTYRTIMDHFACPAVGFTATMTRGDSLALGEIWTDVVYTRGIAEMIRDGFLCSIRGVRVMVPDLDLRKVRRMHGDYSEKALGAALEGSLAPQAIARAWTEHAAELPGLLFAPTVASARLMADTLAESGFRTGLVYGAMPAIERARALDDFREGKVQILANCMVLTEGTDLPMATVAAIARPTTNQGLYVQMVGRVLRPHPGKVKALTLDLVGASAKHSLMSPVDLFGESVKELDRDLVETLCPDCGTYGCECALDEIDLTDDAGGDDQVWIDGELEAVEVDLFHGSASAWQRTTGTSTWFIRAGERYIALVPGERGTDWDVVWMYRYASGPGNAGWVARGVPELGYAMAYAEGAVTDHEKATAEKDRSWRAQPAPAKMRAHAAQILGADYRRRMSRGEIDALITQAEASARIDPAQMMRLGRS